MMVLLAGAIACGLVSFFPWSAAILAAISSPIFIRYYVLRRQVAGGDSPAPGTIIAGLTGAIGLGLGIMAAAAGTLLGTCSVTAWSVAFSLPDDVGYETVIPAVATAGVVVGVACAALAITWLFRRLWPRE